MQLLWNGHVVHKSRASIMIAKTSNHTRLANIRIKIASCSIQKWTANGFFVAFGTMLVRRMMYLRYYQYMVISYILFIQHKRSIYETLYFCNLISIGI
jgi:hypothetical protein